MENKPTKHESFIIRIMREGGQPGWRAWIQHTRSGDTTVVRSVQELVAFFEQRAGKLDDPKHRGLR